MNEEKYNNLGTLSMSRPASKFSGKSSPVEVECARVESRDFIMSWMAPLNSAMPKWSRGRVQSKYPLSWMPKFKRLTRQAAKLRSFMVKDEQGQDKQALFTQVRYDDDDEGLTIYVKNLIEDSPWIPISAAKKRWSGLFIE